MLRRPPISLLFPYTTLFRSVVVAVLEELAHRLGRLVVVPRGREIELAALGSGERARPGIGADHDLAGDRKSTRLNSSHTVISYAVFCLKKKKISARERRIHR